MCPFNLPTKLAWYKLFSLGFWVQILAAGHGNKMEENPVLHHLIDVLACASETFRRFQKFSTFRYGAKPRLRRVWRRRRWSRQAWLRQMEKKNKVPVPCDHGVGRSGGDAREGDWFLVVGGGIEGLLEHGEHRRDCGEKSQLAFRSKK